MMRPVATLLLLLAWGCSDEGTARKKPPEVVLSPADGITSPMAQGVDVGARVAWTSRLSLAQEDLLVPELSLRTWPEFDLVATTVVVASDGLSVDGGSSASAAWTEGWAVRLIPTVPLETRWYVVRLAAIPAGFHDWVSPGNAAALSDGSRGARFHTGSSPVLRQAVFQGPKGGQINIELIFSEPVMPATGDGTTLVTAVQDGVTLACRMDARSNAVVHWYGGCSGGVADLPITYTVAAGVAAEGGAAATGLPYTGTAPSSPTGIEGFSRWTDLVFSQRGPT